MQADHDHDEAIRWMVTMLEWGDEPIDPQWLTGAQLREFVWWLMDEKHYQQFKEMVSFRNQVLRHVSGV